MTRFGRILVSLSAAAVCTVALSGTAMAAPGAGNGNGGGGGNPNPKPTAAPVTLADWNTWLQNQQTAYATSAAGKNLKVVDVTIPGAGGQTGMVGTVNANRSLKMTVYPGDPTRNYQVRCTKKDVCWGKYVNKPGDKKWHKLPAGFTAAYGTLKPVASGDYPANATFTINGGTGTYSYVPADLATATKSGTIDFKGATYAHNGTTKNTADAIILVTRTHTLTPVADPISVTKPAAKYIGKPRSSM